PLTELELGALYPLICMRLAVSVTNSALQHKLHPDNQYLLVSEGPAWKLLEKLRSVDPALPHYLFRRACKLEPVPQRIRVVEWLKQNSGSFVTVVDADLKRDKLVVFDLSVGSPEFSDPEELADT